LEKQEPAERQAALDGLVAKGKKQRKKMAKLRHRSQGMEAKDTGSGCLTQYEMEQVIKHYTWVPRFRRVSQWFTKDHVVLTQSQLQLRPWYWS